MKHMKKTLSLLLTAVMLLSVCCAGLFAQALVSYGSCGPYCSYQLDESGVLAISVSTGTSTMNDYSGSSPAPWKTHASKIKKITIGKGVTNIGAYAFNGLTAVTDVVMDKTVTKIGLFAFQDTTSLNRIYYNGTREQMKSVTVLSGNERFTAAAVLYTNEIGTIALTVTPPKVGDKVSTDGIKAPEGLTFNSVYWTRKNSSGIYAQTTDTTFQAGGEYGIYVSFSAKTDYSVYSSANATVNGETATFKKNSPNNYSVSYRFDKLKAEVSSVAITGLSAPSYGATISTSGIKASAGFIISDSYWTKKNSSGIFAKTTDTTFQRGGEYGLYVSGKIADDYTAAATVTATIGGKSATVQKNGPNYGISCRYDAVKQNVWVTFDPDGGTLSDSEKTKIVTVDGTYGALPTPTKSGKSFDGWYDGSTKITSTSTVTKDANHTLKAHWKDKTPTTVTVTFDPNGGTMLLTEQKRTVTVGSAYGTLPDTVRSGYNFLGWYDGDTLIAADTTVSKTADHTLKAKWESKSTPHTEHTYDAGKVTKEATCTATGEMTYTCTVCGSTKTETIPKAAHAYGDAVVTKKATCTATGEQSYTCTVCGGSYTEVIPKAAHAFVEETTPATLKKSGEVTGTCSVCGETARLRVIYRPKTYTLSANKFTYNGKAKTPSVTVTDAKGKIIDPENYTVSYSNNKQVGAAKVKIVFSGDYSGTKTVKFKILPKKTGIKKLTAGNGAFKATWKQNKTGDGYQIQYATNSKFKSAKTININDASVTAKTVKKLLAEKTYFVRIRTAKVVGSKTYYSDWSKTYKIKTK